MSSDDHLPVLESDDEFDAPRGGLGCFRIGLIGCGVLALLCVVFLGVVGWAIETGRLPDTAVVRGEDLSDRIRDRVAEVALEDGETILGFYSSALFDAGEDGNVLTDRRVISYSEDPATGDVTVESIALEDVGEVQVEFSDDFITDSDLYVWPADSVEGSGMVYLWLCNEDDGDHLFVHDLVRTARAAGADVGPIIFSGAVEPSDYDAVEGAVPAEE